MNSTLRSMTNRMMIGNIDIPLIVVMRPNPQSFTKNSGKLNNATLTNSGFVTSHFGNELDTISIQGYTSSKVRNPKENTNKSSNVLSSIVNSFTGNNDSAEYGSTQWADIDRFLMKLEQLVKLDKERLGSLTELLTSNYITGGLSKIVTKVTNPITGTREDFVSSQNTSASMTHSFIIYQYVYYSGYFTKFNWSVDVNDPSRYKYSIDFTVTQSSTDWLTKNLITNFPEARIVNMFTQVKDVTNFTSNLLSNSDQLLKSIFL